MPATTFEETQAQSERAYKRWGELWHNNARENTKTMTAQKSLERRGVGRQLILFAFGPSFQENVEKIKKSTLHHCCDIMAVDKASLALIDNGIIPKYIMVADAQVDFEKYGRIPTELVKSIELITVVTANHHWSDYWKSNGGNVHYILNKDGIRTQKVYGKYLEDKPYYFIPAASNVSNSAYVVASLVMAYPLIYLAAFDFSYNPDGLFYGQETEPPKDTNYGILKKEFNCHIHQLDVTGELRQVSANMDFSCRWLMDFINNLSSKIGITTINITEHGMLTLPFMGRVA